MNKRLNRLSTNLAKIIEEHLKNFHRDTKLYYMVKKYLKPLGYWKDKPRGKSDALHLKEYQYKRN